jgi:hypothetical protein
MRVFLKASPVIACATSVLLLCFSPASAFGQSVATGTVRGIITDASGSVIVDATIALTDSTTKIERTTTTNDTGHYTFANVPPGVYDVTLIKQGFHVVKFVKQQVTIGSVLTLNASMEIGPRKETIEVIASQGADLQTTNATVGNTMTGVSLESLPSLGRDVCTFVTLQPGVAPDGSVAGANQDQNSFMLDGGNNSSDLGSTQNTYTPSFAGDPSGGLVSHQVTFTSPDGAPGGGGPTGVMPTPVDSIEEFKVGTTNQTADFNSSGGAQIQLVTKRGTNHWHGTLYEYYLNNGWNANSFDNNTTASPLPVYHYNRFGGSVGGPVIPKKTLGGSTFLFANYEGAVARLAKGAEILVHEAMYVPAVEAYVRDRIAKGVPTNFDTYMAHMKADHSPIQDVGRIAQEAGVKTLVLSHLVPGIDGIPDDTWRDQAAKHFKGDIRVAHGLTVI